MCTAVGCVTLRRVRKAIHRRLWHYIHDFWTLRASKDAVKPNNLILSGGSHDRRLGESHTLAGPITRAPPFVSAVALLVALFRGCGGEEHPITPKLRLSFSGLDQARFQLSSPALSLRERPPGHHLLHGLRVKPHGHQSRSSLNDRKYSTHGQSLSWSRGS